MSRRILQKIVYCLASKMQDFKYHYKLNRKYYRHYTYFCKLTMILPTLNFAKFVESQRKNEIITVSHSCYDHFELRLNFNLLATLLTTSN